ncbi:MAG: hypothetical protein WC559_05095 [Candidatus Omnitrophota bacterium]
MESKAIGVASAILWGIGILLLLAAAFDVLPISDNEAIFLAIACFIIMVVVKRIGKTGSGCCK